MSNPLYNESHKPNTKESMNFHQIIRILSKYIPYPKLDKNIPFSEWKSKLLMFVMGGLVVMGFIAYVPSVIYSIKEKLWSIVFIDSFVYASVIFVVFTKKLNARTKINLSLAIFFILA